MKVTLLGCGSSAGVPMVGCTCNTCTSNNPKNKRSRVSVFIGINGKGLLIDTSPDLRQQALQYGVNKVDAILYTHDHADHTHGIDDLRSFNYLSGKALPIYCNQETYDSISRRFDYTFKDKPKVWFRPCLQPNILADEVIHSFKIDDISITCFNQLHGKTTTLGYRIGNFAYSTDVNDLSEEAFTALEGVDVWIVDCLRYTKSPTHANLETTLNWIDRVRPRRAILTHMAHEMEYEQLASELPNGVEPGFDGLQIALN